MNIQTLLIVAVPNDQVPVHPVQASSADYGFDLDEEEIGREMLAPLPVNLFASPAILEVTGDEFEQVFQCFLS